MRLQDRVPPRVVVGRALPPRLGWALALGVISALSISCTGSSPRLKPPAAPPSVSPQPAAEAPPQVQAQPETPRPPRTVVLDGDAEGDTDRPLSLLEASRRAKELKRNASPPAIVITNENLAKYAERGSLTIARPREGTSVATEATQPGAAPAAEATGVRGEEYWRATARSLRERWRNAADSIEDLELRAEALRYQFYSQEDTFIRDTRIKPSWDRALDQLDEARREAEAAQAELEEFLEDGRQAGALPGWLSEGIELEPEDIERKTDDLPETDAIDPVTIDEDGNDR